VNIFFLDVDPQKAAEAHCDKHVNKMIIEHLQMMSVALDYHGLNPAKKKDGNFYSVRAFKNHPCTKWVKESRANFTWTWDLTWHLCKEFEVRYGKEHSGINSLKSIQFEEVDAFYPDVGMTQAAQAMPDFCKVEGDAIQAYRNYYNQVKWKFATWKTTIPSWWAPACSLEAKESYG
jgi:hypothetical protein